MVYLDFLTFPHVFILRDGVGDDDGFEAGVVDPERNITLMTNNVFEMTSQVITIMRNKINVYRMY